MNTLGLEPADSLALTLHHAPGACALLVGSGLSRAAGIPSGWEITLDLVRKLAALKGVVEEPDWAVWYQQEFGEEANYSTIIDALATTPAERRSLLHRYIEPQAGEDTRKPTKAHRAIANLVAEGAIKVIVTTNFDRLLERAIQDLGIEPTVITDEHSLAGATPLVHSDCVIIKLHGDYLDTRIKNTSAELASYHPDMDRLLDRIFDEYGTLVLGWSGEWDTALRQAVQRASTRRYPFFWASRVDPGQGAADLIAHRQGQRLKIKNADEFMCRLVDQLKSLREVDRLHPTTIAASLALAKRYCRSDDFEVEWAEFLEVESAKIRAFVMASDWPTERPTPELMKAQLLFIQSRTEVLRRSFQIAARWGTEKAAGRLARALGGIGAPQNSYGAYTLWVDLRDLPAALCFYWAVTGFLDADRLVLLRELLQTQVRYNGGKLPAANRMALLEFNTDNFWNHIVGDYSHRAWITSRWLEDAMTTELSDISVPPDERIGLVEQTECVVGLQFAFNRATTSQHAWFPVGSYVDRPWFNQLLDSLLDSPPSHPWIKAGLLGGTAGAQLATGVVKATLGRA
jgi:hypothetical protein